MHQKFDFICAAVSKPDTDTIVQLGIVTLTNSPALDVQIDISPTPGIDLPGDAFPLKIPAIDSRTPFFMDIATTNGVWQEHPRLALRISYRGLDGESYVYDRDIDVDRSIPPLAFLKSNRELSGIQKALESIASKLPKQR